MPSCVGKTLLPVLLALAGMLHATAATAHVVNVFALVDAGGKTISGRVYFAGGVAAQGAKVEAFDPRGAKLAETTTDAEGEFSLPAAFHCDYRIVAEAGEGHAGEYTVEAAELPDDLPPPSGTAAVARSEPADSGPTATATPASTDVSPRAGDAELAQLIESAVAKQVAPLRQDLYDLKKARRMQDFVGGVGYIVGVMGLLCFVLAIRRKGPGAR